MALSASDIQAVYSLLANSLSAEESLRKPAEANLAQCESRPGFCSCLLEIIAARDLACREDVRLLASVYFKNSISRYWRYRRDTPGGISNEEKIHIRNKLLLHIREENTKIALQLAVLISKIARIDYPKEWPDLFSSLAQQLQSADVLASHRVFMVLYRALKELSTKRLASDQRNFSEITAHLFEYTWNLWNSDVRTILQNFAAVSQSSNINTFVEESNDLLLICERWLFCLKIVRQLIISGYPSDKTSAQEVWQVKEVCPAFLSAVQSFLPYLKTILECKEYKPSLTGRVINEMGDSLTLEDRKKSISAAVSGILKNILPNDRVILLCNTLIRSYISFQLLAPVVVSILHEAIGGSPPLETDITPGMLLKDAAYTAAGHVYYDLSNYLNFNEWFRKSLSIELSNGHPNMRIIHRKIALILGQWISQIEGDTKKMVYHALIRLLQDDDVAVRLAACWSLCYVVQDTNFSEQDFAELLPACWTLCFKLIDDVQEFESKVLFLLIMLFHFLSCYSMWEESSGESLLHIRLLVALRNFVCSLGYQSPICYDSLLPILQSGIDVDSPDALNLLEDSVLLWEATLSNAPSIVPQLLEFFPYLVAIIDRSFDHLQVAVNIIEDYIIFGGAEFLKRHASSIAKILDAIVGNVNDKGLLATLPIIDLLVQCYPLEVPLISGVLQKLVYLCLCGDDERNPSRTTVRVTSGAILARLLVMNTNYLAQLASEASLTVALQQAGLSINQNVLLCLVDVWIDKIDNVTAIQRKAYALALSIILTLRLPEVIEKLDEILSVCTSVIMGGSGGTSEEDSRFSSDITSSSWPSDVSVSGKELRKKQIKDSDPIRQFSLEDILRENLKACAALHGEASFNAAISRIHPSAFAQLQQALKMV
ncbi:Importin-11 [Ananas comosus]|uniref:Importin-11 n=1 Tax=Ananas comosus TaxID=4615 RepID=A0A199VBX8_ANACO|nr:Importin-11 [Ananas comosus]